MLTSQTPSSITLGSNASRSVAETGNKQGDNIEKQCLISEQ